MNHITFEAAREFNEFLEIFEDDAEIDIESELGRYFFKMPGVRQTIPGYPAMLLGNVEGRKSNILLGETRDYVTAYPNGITILESFIDSYILCEGCNRAIGDEINITREVTESDTGYITSFGDIEANYGGDSETNNTIYSCASCEREFDPEDSDEFYLLPPKAYLSEMWQLLLAHSVVLSARTENIGTPRGVRGQFSYEVAPNGRIHVSPNSTPHVGFREAIESNEGMPLPISLIDNTEEIIEL